MTNHMTPAAITCQWTLCVCVCVCVCVWRCNTLVLLADLISSKVTVLPWVTATEFLLHSAWSSKYFANLYKSVLVLFLFIFLFFYFFLLLWHELIRERERDGVKGFLALHLYFGTVSNKRSSNSLSFNFVKSEEGKAWVKSKSCRVPLRDVTAAAGNSVKVCSG